MPNQLEPLADDRYCQHDKADGTRCGAFRTKDSPYCNAHNGGLEAAQKRQAEKVKRQEELKDELDFDYFSTKTRADVQILTEKIINGVIKGTIKKDKGALLSTFLPFAYKVAKELEGKGGVSGSVTVKVSDNQMLSLHMDEAAMDRYLAGDEHVRVQMLEDLQSAGNLRVTKGSGSIIDVKPVDADKVKVPAEEISKISQFTDVPQSPKQVLKLFGKNLGEADKLKNEKGPDMVGFGHVFEIGGRPEASDPVKHKWKGKYEPDMKTGLAKLWFTCEYCGRREPNVVEEICKVGNK